MKARQREKSSSTCCLTSALDVTEKDPVPTVQRAGWTPGPVLTGAENLSSTEIRSPDRPASSNSLHQIHYHGPQYFLSVVILVGKHQKKANLGTTSHRR